MLDDGWADFADAVLSQEALLARIRFGNPDPTVGLHVPAKRVDDIIDELGGGDLAGAVRAQWAEPVALARDLLITELGGVTPFASMVRVAQLTLEEAEVFAVLCAVEVDSRRQQLMVYVQDDITRMWPTIETLARAFGDDHRGIGSLAPSGALRRSALVRPVEEADPWSRQMARLEPAVVWALLGERGDDVELPVGALQLDRDELDLDHLTGNVDVDGDGDEPVDTDEPAPLVLVVGPDRIRRRQRAAAELPDGRFLVTPLPEDRQWPAVVRRATIDGAGVIVETDVGLPAEARGWIERAAHLSWAVSSPREVPVDAVPSRPWIERRVEDERATDAEWAAVLGGLDRRGHRLSVEHLHQVRTLTEALDGDVDAAVRRLASGLLDGLATRISPRRSWDDLVLPTRQLAELQDLCERYRRRDVVYDEWGFGAVPSAGLVAVFAGESGTGKTMTAEVVAGDLGLDLYRIDLSSVVSKWVGETEKNLERIFSGAAAGNLVLFFDEADAIFGKRSDVKEANDRYANIEVSYLLQRLESYDGLVILATNLLNNIDRAFMRRVHVSVEFRMPDVNERRRIWLGCLPSTAPLGDLDLDLLAERFEIAGGNIRSAALTAAFLAATAEEAITMRFVMAALHRELRKMGRMPTAAMFGPFLDGLDAPPEDQRTR